MGEANSWWVLSWLLSVQLGAEGLTNRLTGEGQPEEAPASSF
jgi:hypothetical protein